MKTGINILFDLIDVSAKADTTATIDDVQSFIDPQDLSLEGVFAPKVATLEPDYWKLDGTFDTFPDSPEDISWGVWSNSMSGADGSFAVPPVLILTFSNNHSAMGIGFEFNPHDDSYCNSLNVKYYNGGQLISNLILQPNSWRYSYEHSVENYNKMVLTFYGMNKADRYLKLQSIIHGLTKSFVGGSGDDIIGGKITEATLLEEVDITSSELTINTLDFKVFTNDDDFNIFNPQGVYGALQKKQQINLTGMVNGVSKSYGTFYLDEWKSEGNKIMSMSTVDSIGIMDGTYFYGGIYANKPVTSLVEEIMNSAGFGYSLDSSFTETTVSGWLPYCTHREALQQVAIAIGAYVDTSRGGAVMIKPQPNTEVHSVLGRNRKFNGSTSTLKTYVSGVNVTEHSYTLSAALSELYNGELPVGRSEIIFSGPSVVSTVTGATLVKSGVNYCIVEVATKGTVLVKGKRYSDNTKILTYSPGEILAGEKENVLTLTDATLVSSSNSKAVAARIFNYHQKRIQQDISFVLGNEAVGETIEVEVLEGIHRSAIIESLSTNLTGGFVTKAVVVGE